MEIKKLTISAMLVAIGVFLGNILYIPVGISKCFFIQHTINVVSGFILGPFYGVIIAFLISIIRNIFGTGSILAFPGSMIGAFLAGMLFKYSKNIYLLLFGEVFGTGVVGAIFASYVARLFMDKDIVVLFFVYPFLLSSMVGGVIGFVLLKSIKFNNILTENRL